MALQIREIKKKDYKKAISWAVTGMHFDWYVDSRFMQRLYGRYFWYSEIIRATQILAVYSGDTFAGVLLAELYGEPRKEKSLWKAFYTKLFEGLQKLFAGDGVSAYDQANRELLAQYRAGNAPEGEIIFLAADPESKERGIGSLLLEELARREKGKQVYLYTDNACTYQFYEHRGFAREGEKDIVLKLGKKVVPLKCFLYSRRL